jgi:hypothetical protein
MVLEVLIAFGLCVVAEACFQIADRFDCRQRKLHRHSAARRDRNELGVNVR